MMMMTRMVKPGFATQRREKITVFGLAHIELPAKHASPLPPRGHFIDYQRLPASMRVRPSIKRLCESCRIIRRKGVARVVCKNPRHKQRQG